MMLTILGAGISLWFLDTVVADHRLATTISARDTLFRGEPTVRTRGVRLSGLQIFIYRDTTVKYKALTLEVPLWILFQVF